MRVPLAQVKEVCTKAELTLVTMSRPPRLGKLSSADAKKSAGLARKLFQKWRDLNRDQARDRSRKVGSGERETRTELKVRIFQDAVQDLESRASLDASSGEAGSKPSRGTLKKARTLKHRATRASVRAKLSEKNSSLNAKAATNKKVAAPAKPAAKTTNSAKRKATKSAGRGKRST